MINYTERLSLLMQDIVARVPTLSFIDMSKVLVFARSGRTSAEGAYATCHCVCLPPSEPGYYFWRDRTTGQLTRRSEWFVTKSPSVTIEEKPIDYMVSFTLPRFTDQILSRSRKQVHYRGQPNWVAKLDTIVHELYHIDPARPGIRRMEKADGTYSANCHGDRFFADVVEMVNQYLDTKPDPAVSDFLHYSFTELSERFGTRRRHRVQGLPVVSAALHRGARPAAAAAGRSHLPRGAAEGAARHDGVHRRRPRDARIPAANVPAPAARKRAPRRVGPASTSPP